MQSTWDKTFLCCSLGTNVSAPLFLRRETKSVGICHRPQGLEALEQQYTTNRLLAITHPMDVDGREHVLEHGGHNFNMHALGTKVVEHQKWVVGELLLMHPMPLQGGHNVFDE